MNKFFNKVSMNWNILNNLVRIQNDASLQIQLLIILIQVEIIICRLIFLIKSLYYFISKCLKFWVKCSKLTKLLQKIQLIIIIILKMNNIILVKSFSVQLIISNIIILKTI